MALRVASSQSPEELQRRRADSELAPPFRALAANVLRIVRGAGRPEALGDQMVACFKAVERYREAHGNYPKPKVIRQVLDPDEADFEHGEWVQMREEEALKMLSMSGEPEKLEAERMLRRGALQITASRLLGQHTQEILGEHELYGGVHLMKEALVVSNFYWTRKFKRDEADRKKQGDDVADDSTDDAEQSD